jgi:long-chain acyl-CoA synthetase
MQGEYVAPEKIENVYTRSPLVAQCFVYGNSLRSQLVAIVVPDSEELLPWAAQRGLTQDVSRLCQDPAVTAAVLKSMLEEGRTAKLRGFEQVWPGLPTCARRPSPHACSSPFFPPALGTGMSWSN